MLSLLCELSTLLLPSAGITAASTNRITTPYITVFLPLIFHLRYVNNYWFIKLFYVVLRERNRKHVNGRVYASSADLLKEYPERMNKGKNGIWRYPK